MNTGAEASVFPATNIDRRSGHTVPVCVNSQRFEWDFVIADVAQPLFGADLFVIMATWSTKKAVD